MQHLLANHCYKEHEWGGKKISGFCPTLVIYVTNCWAQGTDRLAVISSFSNSKDTDCPLLWAAAVLQAIWDEGEWFIWNPDISQQNLWYSRTERAITRRVVGANKTNTPAHLLWQGPVFKTQAPLCSIVLRKAGGGECWLFVIGHFPLSMR